MVIRHPTVGRRVQCLQCGDLGHTAARCGYTDVQLRGPGGLDVTELYLQNVEDLAKPFSSVVEMRRIAGERLFVQQSEAAAAQAAITPHGVTSFSHTDYHNSVRAEPAGTFISFIHAYTAGSYT